MKNRNDLLALVAVAGSLLVSARAYAGHLDTRKFDQMEQGHCDRYVSAARGSDSNHGTARSPYRTITFALMQAHANDEVCVEAGTYDAALGESFPIIVPDAVTLRSVFSPLIPRRFALEGHTPIDIFSSTVGRPVIKGAGDYNGFASISLVASDRSTISGFTVRIPSVDLQRIEVGVWVLEGTATISHNVFEGIAYGHPGGACVGVGGEASPLIEENLLVGCHDGIALFGNAKPRIRRNVLLANENWAVYADENAAPDLGTADDPGGNVLRHNGHGGLYNYTVDSILDAAGNIWEVNCATDALGRYASRLVMGPASDNAECLDELSNYKIQNEGAGIQF